MSHAPGGADEPAATPGLTPSSRAPDGELDAIHQTCGFRRYHQAKSVYDDDGEEDDISSGASGGLSNYVIELGEHDLNSLGELKQMLQQPQQHEHHKQQQASTPIACSFTDASAPCPTIWARATDEGCPPPASVLPPQPQSPLFALHGDMVTPRTWLQHRIDRQNEEIANRPAAVTVAAPAARANHHQQRQPKHEPPKTSKAAFLGHVPAGCEVSTHMHQRNPILEKEHLISYGKDAAANGLKWDASSCFMVRFASNSIYSHNSIATPVPVARLRISMLLATVEATALERYALRPVDA
ncbi:hypothetical protein DL766_007116 [Monosporascus sp. MC13-8B]|uniref:Uncharacterized protein n=1 Tax=Monosporascus cannonballus TaxID=155416 RepID=A0ABY0HCB1_9PEZI|nr:hypothetical protein DL762_003948 [Monosporascus cannonballus]RYO94817.1 hypothetical protein DL763_003921 [Monosporascus cannonballus]RYP25311.1 hypothetical protein DL766_007116 [Monosporascus sp. MC13-8B]